METKFARALTVALSILYVAFGVSCIDSSVAKKPGDMWIEQSEKVLLDANEKGIAASILTIDAAGDRLTAAASDFREEENRCIIYVVPFNNPLVDEMLSTVNKKYHEALIYSIIVHEMGHCVENMDYPERIPVDWETSTDVRNEGFADVYSLALVAKNYPDAFKRIVRHLNLTRRETLRHGPKYQRYDTIDFLDRSDEIMEMSKTHTAEEVANYIVYGSA